MEQRVKHLVEARALPPEVQLVHPREARLHVLGVLPVGDLLAVDVDVLPVPLLSHCVLGKDFLRRLLNPKVQPQNSNV